MTKKTDLKKEKISIGIVSGSQILRDCLSDQIDRSGQFRVAGSASSEEELLPVLERSRPRVLLIDTDTIGAAPEALLVRLRSRWPDLKILVLSSGATETVIVRTLRYGAAGVLGQGEGLAKLFQALEVVLAGQVWAGRSAIAQALSSLQSVSPPSSPALTPRERQLLGLLGDGYRNKEIATMVEIKEQTVKIHLHNLFRKLGVRNRLEAALKAAQLA